MPCSICRWPLEDVSLPGSGSTLLAIQLLWCPRCGSLSKMTDHFRIDNTPEWTRLSLEGKHEEVIQQWQEGK